MTRFLVFRRGRVPKVILGLGAAALSVVLSGTEAFAAGGLDQTFGSGGVTTISQGVSIAGGGVVVDPAGGILVEGEEQTAPSPCIGDCVDITVTHLLANGQPDPTFGTGGTVLASLGQTYTGTAIAVQPDGKILAAGGIRTPGGSHPFGMGVVRLTAAGQIDSNFGTNGVAVVDHCANNGQASAAAVRVAPDGSIILIGTATCIADETDQLAVARLDSTGKEKPFGATGSWLLSGPSTVKGYDGAVDSSGRIVAAGYNTACTGGTVACFYVERFTTSAIAAQDGALDPAFASGGLFTDTPDGTLDTNADAYNVAQLSSGDIVVSGACDITINNTSNWYICADELTSSGSLDSSNFGTGGRLIMPDGNVGSQSMAIEPNNGDIVFGSVCPKSMDPCGLVARASSGGVPDSGFGNNPCAANSPCPGVEAFHVPNCKGAVNGVAADSTRIYAAGAEELSTQCLGASPTYDLFAAALTES